MSLRANRNQRARKTKCVPNKKRGSKANLPGATGGWKMNQWFKSVRTTR